MNRRQRQRKRDRKERFALEVALAGMLHAEQEGWFDGLGPPEKLDRLIIRLSAMITACIKNFPKYEREWKEKHPRRKAVVPNRLRMAVPSTQ